MFLLIMSKRKDGMLRKISGPSSADMQPQLLAG